LFSQRLPRTKATENLNFLKKEKLSLWSPSYNILNQLFFEIGFRPIIHQWQKNEDIILDEKIKGK